MFSQLQLLILQGLWIPFVAFLAPGVVELHGQQLFPAWVSLYGAAPVTRLENENRLSALCTFPETMSQCYNEQLAPTVTFLPLHANPDRDSSRLGEILVVVVPGRGLSGYFRPAESSIAPEFFTPDLFLQDWGYGIYFHQTIADQIGNWVKLPPRPWASSVWLEVPKGNRPDSVLGVQEGDIIEMEGSGWYVVTSMKDQLLLRPEQPGDAWCLEGDPPPIHEVEPTQFSRAELLDATGHLVFRPKYLKGC